MKKVLVFQHVAHEILGTLNPVLKDAGLRLRYINFERTPHPKIQMKNYQALIILGGPMNVDQIDEYPFLALELDWILEAIQLKIPILGICLGAQLIAKALGAKVKKNPKKEIGWYQVSLNELALSDRLFTHFSESEEVFQWHGDTFEIPQNAVKLASSKLCDNQAFKYQDNVYGLQFHLEVDLAMIERWLKIPSHQDEIAACQNEIDPQEILTKSPQCLKRLNPISERFFLEFVGLLGGEKKYIQLPSR